MYFVSTLFYYVDNTHLYNFLKPTQKFKQRVFIISVFIVLKNIFTVH